MIHLHRLPALALAFAFAVTMSISAARAADATPDDIARVLAGLAPASKDSPLTALTADPAFQRHARRLDQSWQNIDQRQLSKIRAWSAANLTKRQDTAFYFFSGPDFLYANAFLPNAKTYVFAGLEPVGRLPELNKLSRGTVASAYEEINAKINTVLNYSFFITKEMQERFRSGAARGALPIIAVFMVRHGKTIQDVSFVSIDNEGKLSPLANPDAAGPANGVKITFSAPGGSPQTLYYFSTNLHNSGARSTGFLKWCQTLGPGDSFVKSASYLMHDNNFSTVRDFLLENSASITQDDSGIPLRFFDQSKWTLKPFGNYVGPISLFANSYQPKLKELFVKAKAPRIDFGIGYRWRPGETNLLLAIRH
jgi:hypothetical protein